MAQEVWRVIQGCPRDGKMKSCVVKINDPADGRPGSGRAPECAPWELFPPDKSMDGRKSQSYLGHEPEKKKAQFTDFLQIRPIRAQDRQRTLDSLTGSGSLPHVSRWYFYYGDFLEFGKGNSRKTPPLNFAGHLQANGNSRLVPCVWPSRLSELGLEPELGSFNCGLA